MCPFSRPQLVTCTLELTSSFLAVLRIKGIMGVLKYRSLYHLCEWAAVAGPCKGAWGRRQEGGWVSDVHWGGGLETACAHTSFSPSCLQSAVRDGGVWRLGS